MTITYKLIKNEFGNSYIERTDDAGVISFIPTDPANSDYQTYLAWLEDPNAEITPPVL